MTTEEFIQENSLQDERWYPIPQYADTYLISNFGRIISKGKSIKCIDGRIKNVNPKLLRVSKGRVCLYYNQNKFFAQIQTLLIDANVSALTIADNEYESIQNYYPDEIWKPIEDYPLYEISNIGRVKSFYRYSDGRVLKPQINSAGYHIVMLYKDGKGIQNRVHRLVANAFIPNPQKKPHIDHINTDTLDNRVENLRWVTRIENAHNPITEQKVLSKKRDEITGRYI